MIVYTNGRGMSRGKLKIEDGKWRMNDTIYGDSAGLDYIKYTVSNDWNALRSIK